MITAQSTSRCIEAPTCAGMRRDVVRKSLFKLVLHLSYCCLHLCSHVNHLCIFSWQVCVLFGALLIALKSETCHMWFGILYMRAVSLPCGYQLAVQCVASAWYSGSSMTNAIPASRLEKYCVFTGFRRAVCGPLPYRTCPCLWYHRCKCDLSLSFQSDDKR